MFAPAPARLSADAQDVARFSNSLARKLRRHVNQPLFLDPEKSTKKSSARAVRLFHNFPFAATVSFLFFPARIELACLPHTGNIAGTARVVALALHCSLILPSPRSTTSGWGHARPSLQRCSNRRAATRSWIPAPGSTIETLAQAVAARGLSVRDLEALCSPTFHLDHAGERSAGAGKSAAVVYVHRNGAPHMSILRSCWPAP